MLAGPARLMDGTWGVRLFGPATVGQIVQVDVGGTVPERARVVEILDVGHDGAERPVTIARTVPA